MNRKFAGNVMVKYINSWLNRDMGLFLSLLDDDVVVNECTGDSYLNKQVAENWFKGWHAEGNKVLAWDIKEHFYDEENEVATVTWRFTCLYQEKEYTFDGTSVAKFRNDKIVELDEYQMETEKRFPYMEENKLNRNNIGNFSNIEVNNGNFNVTNDINIQEDKSEIIFEKEKVGETSKKTYERKNYILCAITSIAGLILALAESIVNLIKGNGFSIRFSYFVFGGLVLICLACIILFRYLLKLKKNKIIRFSDEYTVMLEDDRVCTYAMIGKCVKCGGAVKLKKARVKDGENERCELIGACVNSTSRTKHYYEYDDITHMGIIIPKELASKYILQ